MRKLFAILFATTCATAQNLPSEMYFSEDGKILYTGGILPTSGLYDVSTVKNVYLNFSQANYWTQLTNNYSSETNIAADMIYDGVTYPNVGVRFRGNTSYMQIGTSQKKSFAVETDFVDVNQKVLGYNDLKFNNAHQDATFMREVLYNRMARKYIPIAKANFIHLYLNNQDWGIYPNVQSIDKSFLEEWFLSNDGGRFRATVESTGGGGMPSWGDGTAALNYLGASAATYQQYYTLKSNDVLTDPWQSLIEACQSLSTATASNLETVKTKIDIDKALWFLACENIFTDDDSYIMKGKMDYMVYIEPETGRTTPLEYDGNSTFQTNQASNSNWGPFKNVTDANYPLLYKLLNIPELRQRYLAHYRTILNETFTTTNATTIIDGINSQISALVASDPKKLYTTAQYTSGVPALKTFVTNRRNYLLSNTEVAQVAPVISSAKYYNSVGVEYQAPVANEIVTVKAVVSAASGINKVNLYYGTGLVGNFTKVTMFDDGAHQDGANGDGIYGATIPGYASGTFVRYYVEAIANNTSLSASYLPTGAEHDIFVYTVGQEEVANGVVINELMAQNTSTVTDENNQYEDWIELYNTNSTEIDLSGFYLTDDATNLTKWEIPAGTVIAPNDYLIVWADEDSTEGPLHANFKLSAAGEVVILSDTSLNLVDEVTFGAQTANQGFARIPNGTGNFVIQNPTFGFNNESVLENAEILDKPNRMIMYPNPAQSWVTVQLPQTTDNRDLLIYNTMGQLVMRQPVNQTEIQLSVQGFASGVYLLQFDSEVQRLIVR